MSGPAMPTITRTAPDTTPGWTNGALVPPRWTNGPFTQPEPPILERTGRSPNPNPRFLNERAVHPTRTPDSWTNGPFTQPEPPNLGRTGRSPNRTPGSWTNGPFVHAIEHP